MKPKKRFCREMRRTLIWVATGDKSGSKKITKYSKKLLDRTVDAVAEQVDLDKLDDIGNQAHEMALELSGHYGDELNDRLREIIPEIESEVSTGMIEHFVPIQTPDPRYVRLGMM